MEICRTVTTTKALPTVFAYLADFTTTTQWDPGTVHTTLLSGAGDVGTVYKNVSRFLGRETQLEYVVEEYVPDFKITLRGENATVIARDTMTLLLDEEGLTCVTYHADFAFKGVARLVAPLFAPAFRRLGDHAEVGLGQALAELPA